ncbi:NAD(P)/FAD-dependent oxidoreductase, partial [Pseudactinotalea sp.]|uniref:NAD(P)/FAD-dependent oxidoreductase n=1 Tax=Pseudactinotalea sp. TaxID=1926260 RepID=UPI003B3B9BEB
QVRTLDGREHRISYDMLVLTAGAITRTLPVPGLVGAALGLKTVEEAIAVRDRLLGAFVRAAHLPPGPERRAALTVTIAGGGFTGVELFGELLSLGTSLLRSFDELDVDDLSFHLVEASERILPEVSDGPGGWVVRHLEERGGHIHLNARVVSATDGRIVLSTGEEYPNGILVWATGNGSNPVVAHHTDMPLDARGLVMTRPDLRVGTHEHIVTDAWAAGDGAAIPDLASSAPGALTVPNAQHAVRQGKRLAANILATLRGREPRPYRHHSLGTVATLGMGYGIFQYRRIVVRGWVAWMMHRGYHVLAIPTWQRKAQVLLVWFAALIFGRDIASLPWIGRPHDALRHGGDPDLMLPARHEAAASGPAPEHGDEPMGAPHAR